MSTILYNRLDSELEHVTTLTAPERISIAGFYPYLLLHNSPAGTFTFSLIKSGTTLFSKTFTSSDIKASLSTTDNYAHVFYPIIPSGLIHLESGTYSFKISSSGYAPTETSFLGWCQQFEDVQNTLGYTAINDSYNPLAIRIKLYK